MEATIMKYPDLFNIVSEPVKMEKILKVKNLKVSRKELDWIFA